MVTHIPGPQTEQPPSGISGQGVGPTGSPTGAAGAGVGATGAAVTGAVVTGGAAMGAPVTGDILGSHDGKELPLGEADGMCDPEGTSCASTMAARVR